MEPVTTQKKRMIRKPSRTLIITSTTPVLTEGLVGLINTFQTQKGNTFMIFDTVENSRNAFKTLRSNSDVSVRYAYYRLFFTITGLDDNVNYNDLKKSHIDWITANSGANVLYYKQYRKENKYLGCGDITIDTKESLDRLLNKDEFKNFSFNNLTGVFYRYNKREQESNENNLVVNN
jgi:hypothetical protein